jgi:hypothetical protein
MSTRLVYATLVSAVLLSSCASPTPTNVRPEVAQPLNEAVHLSGYWTPDKVAILAKFNQAASVPNLNSDEQNKVSNTRAIIVARVHGLPQTFLEDNLYNQPYWDPQQRPDYSQTVGYKGLNYRN